MEKNQEKDFLKYASRPTHITHKIFAKNYAAFHEITPVLTLKKPIYVGFTVLELSTLSHYNFVKRKIDAKLLFTDTDSLNYEIKPKDVYEHFLSTNICLISAFIQKIQRFLIRRKKQSYW